MMGLSRHGQRTRRSSRFPGTGETSAGSLQALRPSVEQQRDRAEAQGVQPDGEPVAEAVPRRRRRSLESSRPCGAQAWTGRGAAPGVDRATAGGPGAVGLHVAFVDLPSSGASDRGRVRGVLSSRACMEGAAGDELEPAASRWASPGTERSRDRRMEEDDLADD
jgi:hypothetical protein